MGITNSPDIFQQMINDLFYRFEFIRAYMDEFLTLTKVYRTYHVQKLELTLDKHKEKGIKCNIGKSFFRQTKI